MEVVNTNPSGRRGLSKDVHLPNICMSKLYLKEMIRHKITYNPSELGTNFLVDSGTSEINKQPTAKSWPSEALNSSFSTVFTFTFFLLGLQLRECLQRPDALPQDLPAEPAGLFWGFCLPWGPSVLHWVMICREETQGRPHISQGRAGEWQTLGHELLLVGLTTSPASVLGVLHSYRLPSPGRLFLVWGGMLGFGREEWSHTSSLIPLPRFDRKLGQCCFCFCFFLLCQRNHCD